MVTDEQNKVFLWGINNIPKRKNMISIVAKFTVKTGNEEKFLALTEKLVAASRAEAGCVGYSLNKHVEKENTYCMLEQWKDQAAVDAHNASSHFTSIIPQIVELAGVEVDVYQPVK